MDSPTTSAADRSAETGPHGTSTTADSLALQQARERWKAERARKAYYTRRFDLSGLPEYQPEQVVSGTIRQRGVNYIADSGLVDRWEEGFRRHHPDVRFDDDLKSSVLALPALYTGMADLAPMGRRLTWDELTAYQRELNAAPLEITFATGSLDVTGWTYALAVMVHQSNPISKLTFRQLDGIFGAERTGGWNGLMWDTSVARGAEENIRTWGQLGLGGEWEQRPIHVYGYNLKFHFPDEFARKVLNGGDKWNEQLIEYANEAKPDGSGLVLAAEQFMADLSDDPCGIAYGSVHDVTPQTKPVAVSATDEGPFVPINLGTVQDRTYPLTRDVYYYLAGEPGKPIEPRLREFLRYVVSREGQEAVQQDGKYLPLTAECAAEQLRKLG
ncbi:PstS family phosphate ABC transporter substrate-binding protein [Actinopolymorpha alba]|uniref:PstS family phosphate ABC transporter substrate-binding protein n=1 Tax=Actinopolymorpha alba TaxID=533267 RepID=UPI0003722B0A|nr:substrate-binding domain-containing protein [Actinopolymorpha alba]